MARDRNSRKESSIPTAITLSHAPVRIPPGKISETKPTYHDTVLSFGFLQPVPVCLCSEYSCGGVCLLYPSKRWTCDREMAGTVPGRFPGEFRSTLVEMDPEFSLSWPLSPAITEPVTVSLPVPFALASNCSPSKPHRSASQHGRMRMNSAPCKLGFGSLHKESSG